MPRTEDGEFELVLGNKQLLSVFFIVVVLLGVFFAMGYIWGRNSGPVTAATSGDRGTLPVTPRPDAPSAMPNRTSEPQPARDASTGSAAAPSNEAESSSAEPEKPAEKPLEVPPVNGSRVVTPEPGQMFVQVISMLAMPEAETLVDVLGKKGFRSIIAPGPNEGKFRVLVGPVKDQTEAGRVKTDLENAGFKGAFVKKY